MGREEECGESTSVNLCDLIFKVLKNRGNAPIDDYERELLEGFVSRVNNQTLAQNVRDCISTRSDEELCDLVRGRTRGVLLRRTRREPARGPA